MCEYFTSVFKFWIFIEAQQVIGYWSVFCYINIIGLFPTAAMSYRSKLFFTSLIAATDLKMNVVNKDRNIQIIC